MVFGSTTRSNSSALMSPEARAASSKRALPYERGGTAKRERPDYPVTVPDRPPELLTTSLDECGFALIDNVTVGIFGAVFDRLAQRRLHRDSDADAYTRITPTLVGGDGYDGFTRKALPLHTDGSAWANPPVLIGMVYEEKAAKGGQAVVA